jgi:hypothetical protein
LGRAKGVFCSLAGRILSPEREGKTVEQEENSQRSSKWVELPVSESQGRQAKED